MYRIQKGIIAVIELQDDAFHGVFSGRDVEKSEVDAGSGESGASEELREEGVGDLAGGSCDTNVEDFVAHGWYDVNLIIKILYDRDFI
jgi:hypothetical protein